MDQVRLLDFLLAVISAGLGWWAKTIWDNMRELERDLKSVDKTISDLEKILPKEYVRKVDWDRATDAVTRSIQDMKHELGARLDGIWEELKQKADK